MNGDFCEEFLASGPDADLGGVERAVWERLESHRAAVRQRQKFAGGVSLLVLAISAGLAAGIALAPAAMAHDLAGNGVRLAPSSLLLGAG